MTWQVRLGLDTLTPRERVVLGHLMEGRSAEEIARVDYVSVNTVRSQIASVRIKLGARSALHAVALAYQHQLREPVS